MIAVFLALAAVQPRAPAAACPPEHAAMGHCKPAPKAAPKAKSKPKPPARGPAPKPRVVAPPPKPPYMPQPSVGCTPEQFELGQCEMLRRPDSPPIRPKGPAGTDQPAGNAPPPPAPRVGYADRLYGDAMIASRDAMYREHGGMTFSQVMVDVVEARFRNGRDGYAWDAEGWFGGDVDRLVVKTEGQGAFGGALEDAEVQALYSRAIGPYFNLQAGVRQDIRPKPARTHLAVGIEGLTPYWFELDATAFLSNRGDLSARLGGYYDQRITQRLILQPRAEVNLAASADRARGTGAGVSDLELGLRLRYELLREFAPYVGVVWDRKLGDTARYARAAGEGASDVSAVAGVRFWF